MDVNSRRKTVLPSEISSFHEVEHLSANVCIGHCCLAWAFDVMLRVEGSNLEVWRLLKEMCLGDSPVRNSWNT